MNVEVLNTGTELLLGSIVNTHLAFFAKALFPMGLRIARQVTAPDGEPIRDALAEAFSRAGVILVTGGLGPTTDDVTRDIAADLLGRPLRVDPQLAEALSGRYAARGIPMPERNLRQVEVPEGATVLPNPNGTAPGLYLQCPAGTLGAAHPVHLFLLPGPPRELFPMFEESVLPILEKLAHADGEGKALQGCRIYHVLGLGESTVEERVGERLLALPEIELGYCARPGEVDIRVIGTEETLDAAEKIIMEVLGDRIVARDGKPLEEAVVETLTRRSETVATAESCTGGLVANRLTNVPGASAVFIAGYVTYSNEAKSVDLGVNPFLIENNGAVSAEVAGAMAEGALRRSGVDWALATTGTAGPGGGTAAKPVGTVFIAIAHRGRPTRVEHHRFDSDRETFKTLASHAALDLLRRALDWQN